MFKGCRSRKIQKDPALNKILLVVIGYYSSWNRYKEICWLTNLTEMRNEVWIACSPEVNRLLCELVGTETLNINTEQQLLCQIRHVAVEGLHKADTPQHETTEGGRCHTFLSEVIVAGEVLRIYDPVSEWKLWLNYLKDMVAGELVARLANREHQAKILAEANTLITL